MCLKHAVSVIMATEYLTIDNQQFEDPCEHEIGISTSSSCSLLTDSSKCADAYVSAQRECRYRSRIEVCLPKTPRASYKGVLVQYSRERNYSRLRIAYFYL